MVGDSEADFTPDYGSTTPDGTPVQDKSLIEETEQLQQEYEQLQAVLKEKRSAKRRHEMEAKKQSLVWKIQQADKVLAEMGAGELPPPDVKFLREHWYQAEDFDELSLLQNPEFLPASQNKLNEKILLRWKQSSANQHGAWQPPPPPPLPQNLMPADVVKQKQVKALEQAVEQQEVSQTSSDSDTTDTEQHSSAKGKKKKLTKLKSGILAKPQHTIISKSVLWAHSMLSFDVLEKEVASFSQLSFSQLILGEAECITREGVDQDEIKSRLHILKKLAYYESVLSIDKLRDLYKSFMCNIEKGWIAWGDTDSLDKLENKSIIRLMQQKDKPK